MTVSARLSLDLVARTVVKLVDTLPVKGVNVPVIKSNVPFFAFV